LSMEHTKTPGPLKLKTQRHISEMDFLKLFYSIKPHFSTR
jgi:hypothetical protein